MPDRVSEVLDIVVRACALGDYDSNVVGMAAEIIAEDVFGMIKVRRGTKDIDGVWNAKSGGRTVQVKAWSEARLNRYGQGTFFRIPEASAPDDLLVLLIYGSRAGYEILYKGPTKDVGSVREEQSGVNRIVSLEALRTAHKFASENADSACPTVVPSAAGPRLAAP